MAHEVLIPPKVAVEIEAIAYLRMLKISHLETIYYAYVMDSTRKLVGAVSLRELVLAAPDADGREEG